MYKGDLDFFDTFPADWPNPTIAGTPAYLMDDDCYISCVVPPTIEMPVEVKKEPKEKKRGRKRKRRRQRQDTSETRPKKVPKKQSKPTMSLRSSTPAASTPRKTKNVSKGR